MESVLRVFRIGYMLSFGNEGILFFLIILYGMVVFDLFIYGKSSFILVKG